MRRRWRLFVRRPLEIVLWLSRQTNKKRRDDIDNLMEMTYNRNYKVKLHSELCSKSTRPFTQLNEQPHVFENP